MNSLILTLNRIFKKSDKTKTDMAIENKISEMLPKLNRIPYINYGGCGLSAYAIYLAVKKIDKDADIKIVYLYRNSIEYEQNQEAIETNSNTPTSCSHACIYYKGEYFDCEEAINPKKYNLYHFIEGDITAVKWFIVNSINEIERWNSAFNREKYLPRIQRICGVKLTDIKCA